mgnify:CR=1 FL=1
MGAAVLANLRKAGFAVDSVTGSGTGTFAFDLDGPFTELQVGSYIFMDADYARNLDSDGQLVSTFRHSLFVLSTVMSAAQPGVAVLDAGHKAVSVDSGMPTLWQRPDIKYVSASDEHGKLDVGSEAEMPKLGQKMRLVPGHCDPTVDRYDWYVGVRKGRFSNCSICGRRMRSARQVMVTKMETAVMKATIVKSAALSSSRRRRNMGGDR